MDYTDKYKLLDRPPVKGDVVIMTEDFHYCGRADGSLAIVENITEKQVVQLEPKGNHHGRFHFGFLRVVETRPGSKAKKGDDVISLVTQSSRNAGDVFTSIPKQGSYALTFTPGLSNHYSQFKVLVKTNEKTQPKPTPKKEHPDMPKPVKFRTFMPKSNKLNSLGLVIQLAKFGPVDTRPFVIEATKTYIEANYPTHADLVISMEEALDDYDLKLASYYQQALAYFDIPNDVRTLQDEANVIMYTYLAKGVAKENAKTKPDYTWIGGYMNKATAEAKVAIPLFESKNRKIVIKNAIVEYWDKDIEGEFPMIYNPNSEKFSL